MGLVMRRFTLSLVCVAATCAAPCAAQQQQQQAAGYQPAESSQPPPNYFYRPYAGPMGGGYTGYAQPENYAQQPDYRYQPAAPYYGEQQQQPAWQYQQAPYAVRPRFAFAPAGLVINATLQTPISTQVAGQGDVVQAAVEQNIPLQGLSYIPAGSTLIGQVTESESGRLFNRSGLLTLTFDQLRLPSGQTMPIQAHILGDIGKYAQKNGTMRGEGWGSKLGGFALRAAIGAGSGAVLGTALGAIASHGAYVGTGAWAGTAIGGGLGAVEDLVARRGKNVLIRSGTDVQVQLDAPIQIPQQPAAPYGAGSV